MRLPGPRPRRAEAPNGLAAAARASGRFPALPENADRELPRPPREVAFLIREPERRSGALTVRISIARLVGCKDAAKVDRGCQDSLAPNERCVGLLLPMPARQVAVGFREPAAVLVLTNEQFLLMRIGPEYVDVV